MGNTRSVLIRPPLSNALGKHLVKQSLCNSVYHRGIIQAVGYRRRYRLYRTGKDWRIDRSLIWNVFCSVLEPSQHMWYANKTW